MATITEPSVASDSTSSPKNTADHGMRDQRPRRRKSRPWLYGLGLLGVVGVAAAIGGSQLLSGGRTEDSSGLLTHRVSRRDMKVSVTADGNVESASNIDVKCQVAGGSTILWIIPDGTSVEKGDVVCRLDSAALEDEIALQKITYERAMSTLFQAEKNVETAKIAVEEYRDGTYVKEQKTLQSNVIVAEQNLKSAQDALHHAEKMFKKGFVTALERESKEQGVLRAKLDVEAANTALEVLEKYTRKKTLEDLESQVATAEATYRAEQAASGAEKAKLDRLEKQHEYCELRSPQSGMVVYANDMGGRRPGPQQSVDIEEGATVRQGQSIVKIPDLSTLQVKVVVHESNVQRIKPGMKARIRLQGQDLSGDVTSVANQPEPGSWFGSNVKEYATTVKIEGQHQAIKPGMTAEVEIILATLKDTLTVPVTAVMERSGKYYSFVKQSGADPQRREVSVGESSTTNIQITDGLEEGDEVFLNPRLLEAKLQAAGQGIPEATPGPGEGLNEGGDGSSPSADAADSNQKSGPPGAGVPASGGTSGEQFSSGGPRPGGEAGGPGGGRPGSFRMPSAAEILSQNDADKDGKMSKDEAPEPMKNFFDFIDTDKSGFVEKTELEESIKNMRRRMESGGGPGGGGTGGPPVGGGA